MSIVQQLQALPLFQGISEGHLTELIAIFETVTHKGGTVLFKPGEIATTFDILTKGEVTIEEEGTVRFQLRPMALVGELGSLTGIPRSTTATTTSGATLLSVPVEALHAFFEKRGDIGFAFYKNLLGVVGDKVRRDRRRLDEMRANLIRTQKSMKHMRETVLAAKETEISKPLFEALDTLIENNRRANYRVSPTLAFSSHVRLDSGKLAAVLDVSQGYLKLEGKASDLTNDRSHWAGVMVMPMGEILVSGSILREDNHGVVVKLDTLVDEFKAKLDDYTTRLQLLDFVV